MSWLVIAASPLPQLTANGVGYDTSRRPTGIRPGTLLFNIYTSALPTTVSIKYAYANDLAFMHADEDWQKVEGVLRKDMATLGEYLQNGKLKLSTTKAVLAALYLNNKEAKHELKVDHNNETLPSCFGPTYLGVTLDRTLTYRRHLESLRRKLTSHVVRLRWLALFVAAVLTPASLTLPSTTDCEL